MHDALLVSGFERIADLFRDVQRFVNRLRTTLQSVRERVTFDAFEHQKARTVCFFQAVDSCDIRMI